jgi:hypothetical protein
MNKQTVYIPVSDLNSSELIVCNEGIENSCLDRVKIVEAFVFTPEELKQLLEEYTNRIVENVKVEYKKDLLTGEVDKESITSQLHKFLKEKGI